MTAVNNTAVQRVGATAAEWNHFANVLGLTVDLLPCVQNTAATISPNSSVRQAMLGKVPSRYNTDGHVVSWSWLEHCATSADITRWSNQPDYGLCIKTGGVRAIDVDVPDEALAAEIEALICSISPVAMPKRFRRNSGKFLLAVRVPGELPKRKMVVEGGIIEFLASRQQFVACGTHASGARIEWEGGLPAEIPTLTLAQFDELWSSLELMFCTGESTTGSVGLRKTADDIEMHDPVVEKLYDAGLVVSTDRSGNLNLACPWSDEHTGGEDGDGRTKWFKAGTNGYDRGNFRCLHGHCDGRTTRHLFEFIGYVETLDEAAVVEGFEPVPAEPAKPFVRPAPKVLNQPDYMDTARHMIERKFHDREGHTLLRTNDAWFRYGTTHWKEVEEEQLGLRVWLDGQQKWVEERDEKGKKTGKLLAKPYLPNNHLVSEVTKATQSLCHASFDKTPSWIGNAPESLATADLISMTNGLLDAKTRQLVPHTSRFFNLNALPFAFDPQATAPEWMKFLGEAFKNDQQTIDTLQEVFGYLLTPNTKQQKAFMLIGPRRSGKGTIGRILGALVGADNMVSPTLTSLASNFGLQPLIGKLVALVPDARVGGTNTQAIVEKLLMITGEDGVTIDRKNREAWSGKLTTRFFIMSNELPRLGDASGALTGRFIVMSMKNSFYGREDTGLESRLMRELPGIFQWALDGLARLRERDRFIQPDSAKADIEELEELNSPVSTFLREHCLISEEASVAKTDMFQAWTAWCHEQGQHPGSSALFGRNLRSAMQGRPFEGDYRPRLNGVQTPSYKGVTLKKPFGDNPLGL